MLISFFFYFFIFFSLLFHITYSSIINPVHTFYINKPTTPLLSGPSSLHIGEHITFNLTVGSLNLISDPSITWKLSNNTIATISNGTLFALLKGTTTVSVYLYEKLIASKNITILPSKIKSTESEEMKNKVENILNELTLEQKLGQMFVVGFSGTSLPSSLSEDIKNYHFGNVIYFQRNVVSPSTLAKMSDDLQQQFLLNNNNIPGFIAIDQEGGSVTRMTQGATHFLGEMAIGATANGTIAYELGEAMGKELFNYGINVDFTPVMDVNNEPKNPIIGTRSFSDDPFKVSYLGNNMTRGLGKSNVMGCAKHFPGHGNTSIDTHVGLPKLNFTKDELYKTELVPFLSAISDGIDAIMTTHIIFSAFDAQYPATLSYPILTEFLRDTVGYTGLVFTDGMEMGAVTSKFGGHDSTSVKAIKAGVDLLLYITHSNPRTAHKALFNAVQNGEITIERINESVRRILLKKMKYGLFENWKARNEDLTQMLIEHENLNLKFAINSLTLVKGTFKGLDKSKSTIIFSPSKGRIGNINGINVNSFAEYACKYLIENSMTTCKYVSMSNIISQSQMNSSLELISEYEQVVLAFSDVKINKHNAIVSFVDNVALLGKKLVVVALESPYDLMSYNKTNIETYICVYNYQRETVKALAMFLNGEYEAKGVLPVNKKLFESTDL